MAAAGQAGIAQFLTSLSLGFVQTRLEIILFFVIIIVFLAAISAYFAARSRRGHRELVQRSRDLIGRLYEKLSLNEQEAALLGRLAQYLDPKDSGHSLLVNSHVFDACVRRMSRAGDVSQPTLNALRLKIGFRITQNQEAPSSTAELPSGAPLLLQLKGGARARGTILAQGAGAMLMKLEPGAPPLAIGMSVTMYFHNAAGIFSFPTRITDMNEDAVFLSHSSTITHQQRRKYYRRRESLPVFIRPAATGAEPVQTILLDLGGGGASLQNPKGLLKRGDLLELSFTPQAEKVTYVARVMRVSKLGRVANVRFESLSEAERNRIMGFIFTQAE